MSNDNFLWNFEKDWGEDAEIARGVNCKETGTTGFLGSCGMWGVHITLKGPNAEASEPQLFPWG